MEREEFDRLECEANGHTPHHVAWQLKAERAQRLMKILEREELGKLEPWQAPIYTQYVSRDTPRNTLL